MYVVGWLVCVDGSNRGRDYTIHTGINTIGSGDDMDIQILGDNKIAARRHAMIAFDDKKLEFSLLPGESSGMVYLEEQAIYKPTEVDDRMIIEIGDTKLMFIPLCGEEHKWDDM